ncbi:hypothetical protein SLS62_003656 [Diatrype stigma]|uniref:Uncharacterized protein n=1 Tax=Diatrype stigma TaxID=117547 RepID=A0AAN9UUK6_9PEZI
MASPAVAIPNGVATGSSSASSPSLNHPNQNHVNANVTTATPSSDSGTAPDNAQSFSSSSSASASPNNVTSIKRKREMSLDEGGKQVNHHDSDQHHRPGTPSATTSTTVDDDKTVHTKASTKDLTTTIRDYYEVLERYDATPSILKRPLSEPDSADEPQAKRKKSEEPPGPTRVSIADKVASGEYKDLDAVIADIKASTAYQVAELRKIEPGEDPSSNDEAIARTLSFRQKAHEIFRREITYPNVPEGHQGLDSTNALQTSAGGNIVLSVHGIVSRPTQLYSSLQHPVSTPDNPDGVIRALSEKSLPQGVRMVKAMPFLFPSAVEKDKKSKTLGELFPPPRNLPSLQPPKAPKSTTKGVQVGWHRPELTEKSKYRAGSYSSQPLSTGRWLDYSNAAPPSQIMTKQRERALSLAGTKPSTSDLEASELESLFRGAFSSFAPSKDDSAATISSGMISQTLWWQKVGRRGFDRLIGAEHSEDAANDSEMADTGPAEIDETLIQEAIDNWDDSMVDPSLEAACCPKKADEEKDVDDILQDVSDMIQTLISFQRNRNLQLPTASSQSRYAADPAHSDLLTTGTPAQPSDEESATYDALKAQLMLVIQMLPPYAVARLNSDKLDELNISTKLEVRTEEYQGIMEEDEAAARARAASMAASTPRPTPHRASSSSSSLQYNQQYPTTARAPPMAQPYYGTQTPVRPPSGIQRAPQTMPPTYSQRPPSNTGYRPPAPYPGTPYAQQLTKTQGSYSQPGSYGGTPTQVRPPYPQYPGYPNTASHTPQQRYPSYTSNPQMPPNPYHHQAYQPQHQHPHQHPHPHQQPATPTHPSYGQYTNGTGAMPQRTASPHVPHPTPQHMPQQGYNPAATPTRQPSYGGQPNMTNNPPRHFYPPTGSPAVQHQQPQQPQLQQSQSRSNSNFNGTQFQTSLNSHQLQQAMDQARTRFEQGNKRQKPDEPTRNSLSGPGQSHPPVTAPVGLGGIGLGPDSRMAAARAGMPGATAAGGYSASSQSPKPQATLPNAANPSPATNGSPAVTASGPAPNGTALTAGKEA